MIDYLSQYNPVTQALIGTSFTWMVTALGASLVFFFKKINKDVFNAMLGFAAGVMTAASFWSLLEPGIEMAGELGQLPWLAAAMGFLGGSAFLL
ncbi:MAG TPA: ZIP family metal transporter, partial [Firmicutes bacterium]|nr:ZIP family metal transporter [Bacillota bacterium]